MGRLSRLVLVLVLAACTHSDHASGIDASSSDAPRDALACDRDAAAPSSTVYWPGETTLFTCTPGALTTLDVDAIWSTEVTYHPPFEVTPEYGSSTVTLEVSGSGWCAATLTGSGFIPGFVNGYADDTFIYGVAAEPDSGSAFGSAAMVLCVGSDGALDYFETYPSIQEYPYVAWTQATLTD